MFTFVLGSFDSNIFRNLTNFFNSVAQDGSSPAGPCGRPSCKPNSVGILLRVEGEPLTKCFRYNSLYSILSFLMKSFKLWQQHSRPRSLGSALTSIQCKTSCGKFKRLIAISPSSRLTTQRLRIALQTTGVTIGEEGLVDDMIPNCQSLR